VHAAAGEDEVAQATAIAIRRLFPASSGMVWLLGAGSTGAGPTIRTWGDVRAADCVASAADAVSTCPADQSCEARCYALRRSAQVTVADTSRDFYCALEPPDGLWPAYVCLPLFAPRVSGPERLVGVASVKFPSPMALPTEPLAQLRAVGERAALALSHLRLVHAIHAQGQSEGAVRAARAVAHELSQPLTLLLGHAELLLSRVSPASGELAEIVGGITSAADRVADLISQFTRVSTYAEHSYGPGLEMLDLKRAQRD
jgi:GAF domain-containing protein